MILGAFVASGSWLVVDYFTGMQGNLWQWMFSAVSFAIDSQPC